MKVRYIKSATVVIEHGGKKVLCDPWLTDGIYYGSWFHWPILKFSPADFQDIDYIYISHVHPDHCDVETLKDLPKDKPVLICDFREKFLLNTLRRIGFQQIIEVPNRGTYDLGPDFKVELMAADDADSGRFARAYGHPNLPSFEKSIQIDSLAVFSGGGKTVINSNDVPIALIGPSLLYLKQKYPAVDLLLVSYSGASPFPQAYDIDLGTMHNWSIRCGYGFLGGTMTYIQMLSPKFYMPYAGQYTLGGKCAWMNPYKGTLEQDELILDLVPVLEGSAVKAEMVLLDSGEYFDVDTVQASKPFTPTDFIARHEYIKTDLANKKFVFEQNEAPISDVTDRVRAAQKTLLRKQEEFRYWSDSNFYVTTGEDHTYRIPFDGTEAQRVEAIDTSLPFVHGKLDHRLFDMILDRRANWNNAEIGSHITLTDAVPESHKVRNGRVYEPMAHHMMSYFQEPIEAISARKQDPSRLSLTGG